MGLNGQRWIRMLSELIVNQPRCAVCTRLCEFLIVHVSVFACVLSFQQSRPFILCELVPDDVVIQTEGRKRRADGQLSNKWRPYLV